MPGLSVGRGFQLRSPPRKTYVLLFRSCPPLPGRFSMTPRDSMSLRWWSAVFLLPSPVIWQRKEAAIETSPLALA